MVCALVLLHADGVLAASVNQTLNLSAQVNSRAKIVLNVNAINFVDFVGDHWDVIPANENPVAISASARAGNSSIITLTFLASGDLRSTHRTIPISQITWTATGSGYQNGTMSRTTPRTVGTWTGAGSHTGALSFFFDVRPSDQTGDYTSNGTFTLTAP